MPAARMGPPFRVEHVGSMLRPQRLLDGVRKLRAGALSDTDFRNLQDECITEVVRFQEELGLEIDYGRRVSTARVVDRFHRRRFGVRLS